MLSSQFFLGFFAALALGVPVTLWFIFFAAENVTRVLLVLLAAIAGVVTLLLLLALFRKAIFAALRLKADVLLKDVIDPAVSTLNSALEGERAAAVGHLGKALSLLASWYVQMATQRWAMATLVGLLAAFGAILGSALLARQNSLIVEQNQTLIQQNESLRDQIKLTSDQVRLTLAQTQASTFQETTRIARELIMKAWDDPKLRPLLDPEASNTDPRKIDGFLRVVIQHYTAAYRHWKLGNFPKEVGEEIEADARQFFCSPGVQERWAEVRKFYSKDTQEFVERCGR
jgi:hypothetical protein